MSELKKRGKSSKSKKSSEITESEEPLLTKDDTPSKNSKKTKEIKGTITDKKDDDHSGEPAPPKFGPMPNVSKHRLWSRTALILGLMTVVWYQSGNKKETVFAKVDEDIRFRGMKTKCSPEFDAAVAKFPSCVPKHCGRVITDELVSPEEIFALNDLATRGFKEVKKDKLTAVLDLTSGTLKFDDQSIDIYKLNKTKNIFNSGDYLIFQSIKGKLMRMISSYFGVDYWSIYLSAPTYFTRLTKLTKIKGNGRSEEYWHSTVHKDLYGSFDFSTVLFLSNYAKDYESGRLVFIDMDNNNRTVESKKGRAIAFTSGEESRHFNEKVTKGTRLALTVGFSCDPTKAKKDPLI